VTFGFVFKQKLAIEMVGKMCQRDKKIYLFT